MNSKISHRKCLQIISPALGLCLLSVALPVLGGPCIEHGPYYGDWSLDSCPTQTNSSYVDPTEICQNYGDAPSVPNVVVPIFQDGLKSRTISYDCSPSTTDTESISYSVGGVQWDPPLPGSLTNSFCSTAYVNVTSSDPDFCSDPGRVNIGTCCWCVSSKSTNCVAGGYMTLTNGTVSPTNGCVGTTFSASASYTVSNGVVVITTHCPCSTNADIYQTNFPAPTLVSNWWTASVGSFTTNGTGLSASFTPTNCGSGTVTFNLTYKNSTPCDTNVYSAAPVSVSFNALEIDIVDGGGKTISGANSNDTVIVGQSIGLTASTCGGTFSNFQWTVPRTTESGFYVSSDSLWTNGYPLALTNTTNSTISFFWVDAGSKQVNCQAECSGVVCSGNATFTVVRPTAKAYATTGTVALGNNINNSFYGVCFGTNGGPPGISFSNTLTMPNGYYNGGNTNYSIEWIQTISTWDVTKTTPDGVKHTRNTVGTVVDTTYPYDPYPYFETEVYLTSDSPCVGTSGMIAVSDTQDSKMWLMFKPAGGQWVPLRTVIWSFSGAATNSVSGWTLTSNSHSTNPPDGDAGTTYPIWTDNAVMT